MTISIHKGGGELEPRDDGPWRKAVDKVTARPLPAPRQVAVDAWWWTKRGTKLVVLLPKWVLFEIGPVLRGIWRLMAAWARWKSAAGMDEGHAAAEGNAKAKAAESRERKRTGRTIVTILLCLAAAGGGWWCYVTHPQIFWAVAIALVAIFDAVGRHGQERPDYAPPPALPSVLGANVPLQQIEQAILGTFDREGFEPGSVGIAHPLIYNPTRLEYEIELSLRDQLEGKHLRAIERNIGAKDYSIRNLATDTSTIRKLVIRVGDALALPVDRPFLPTGSRSVTQGIELGVSAGDTPFILPVAGVHIRVVMATGGGKTSWFLRAEIDALSACRDVVLGAIDVTSGPEIPLWRGVIQYRGLNPDDAEHVLDTAIAEIDRRARILAAIAEDDDPDNDTTEWHSGLGPAFVILVDEFAQLAAYNGTGEFKDEPNLMAKVLVIIRTGRKHWVSVRAYSQRAGKDDFGSTTMTTQCAVTVAGPCSPDDSQRLFGVERRDAGYTPHMLMPGVEGDIRDAGKVMISGPMHRTPDLYRVFAPGSASEVKRRARQRMDDGLPSLRDVVRPDAVDAVEVPAVLAAMEQAFTDAGNPERMVTAELLDRMGYTLPRLQTELRNPATGQPYVLAGFRGRVVPGQEAKRGYVLADIRKAIREL